MKEQEAQNAYKQAVDIYLAVVDRLLKSGLRGGAYFHHPDYVKARDTMKRTLDAWMET